jgi:multicomponent Na+:H+ antiporter subunit F
MGNLDMAFKILAIAVMSCIAILIVACLIRSVLGPRVTDRIVAVNSIGTMTIIIIAILSVLLDEAYLLDVCLIYAMISFVAVIVLTKIYTGVYRQEHSEEKEEK